MALEAPDRDLVTTDLLEKKQVTGATAVAAMAAARLPAVVASRPEVVELLSDDALDSLQPPAKRQRMEPGGGRSNVSCHSTALGRQEAAHGGTLFQITWYR